MEESPATFGGINKNRKCTDVSFLVAMVVILATWAGFVGYCVSNADMDRLYNGYDDCGNVCGKNNIKTDLTPYECFGKNHEQNKYLLYETISTVSSDKDNNRNITKKTRKCVESCEEFNASVLYLNRCSTNNTDQTSTLLNNIIEDICICWWSVLLLSLLTFAFSFIMMVLLRYFTKIIIWFVLITMTAFLIAATIYLWISYTSSSENSDVLLKGAIVITILTVLMLGLMACMWKRIKLVIQIFNEAARAVAAMPLLYIQPILTTLAECGILYMTFYTTGCLMESGYLTQDPNDNDPEHAYYALSGFTIFTLCFNFFIQLWLIQFCIDCQHMIIAGSVVSWFFTRDKSNLGSPIIISILNLLKYHLGTVALGSLIIVIIQTIKELIKNRSDNNAPSFIFSQACECIETLLKYVCKNAYIVTAIYGYSFCKSGKHAIKLLVNNIFRVIAINTVGDIALFCIEVYIVLATVAVGALVFWAEGKVHSLFVPLIILAIIASAIGFCFIAVFEMIIDSIFLCFCEDCAANDGVSKPYFMSPNLIEFVENSNKLLNEKNWTDTEQQAWENGPGRAQQRYA